MRAQVLIGAVAIAQLLLACGDEPVCEGDRQLVNGTCRQPVDDDRAPEATASPPGGRFAGPVDVELIAGEEATIYYELGGAVPTTASPSGASPVLVEDVAGDLRFFAVDAAGNEQLFVTGENYRIDETGPAIADIEVHPPDATGAVLVAWTIPSSEDFEEVVVVRDRHDPPSWTPTRGKRYVTGTRVARNVDVVHAGDSSSVLDQTPAAGTSYYHAWGVDDLGNYGTIPATATAKGPFVENRATIAISQSERTVTVVEHPVDFTLSPTGTFNSVTGDISLHIDVSNDADQPLSSVKLYTSTESNGTVIGDEQIIDEAVAHLGLAPLLTGTSRRADFQIFGAEPFPDPTLLKLRIASHPTFIVPGDHSSGRGGGVVIDSGESFFRATIECGALENPDSIGAGRCALYSWEWAPDYALLYAGSRNTPKVAVIDPSTWDATVGVSLGDRGHVPRVRISADGTKLYALVVTGSHRRASQAVPPSNVDFVVLDRDTLVEVNRIRLATDVTQPRGGDLALSSNGARAAAIVRGVPQLFVVELGTGELSAVSLPQSPLSTTLTADGQAAFVGFDTALPVTRVNLDDLTTSTMGVIAGRVGAMRTDDTMLYAAYKSQGEGLLAYELATGDVEGWFHPANDFIALALSADGSLLYGINRDALSIVHVDVRRTMTVGETFLLAFTRGHHMTVTP